MLHDADFLICSQQLSVISGVHLQKGTQEFNILLNVFAHYFTPIQLTEEIMVAVER